MASTQDRTIIYTFQMQTNIKEVTGEIKTGTEESKAAIQDASNQQSELKDRTDETTQALTKQQGQLLTQVTALMAVKSAVSGVTNGLIQMGLVSGEDAVKLQKVNAAIQVMAGFATGIKSLALMQNAFNLAALKSSIIQTYNSLLESPWKLALVGAGVGAAIGAGAALMSQTNSQTTNNIYISDTSDQATVANSISAYTISGGKVL